MSTSMPGSDYLPTLRAGMLHIFQSANHVWHPREDKCGEEKATRPGTVIPHYDVLRNRT